MSGYSYISEGIRFFRVAKYHCDTVEQHPHDAFVSVVFSAMYFESVMNEVIFRDGLLARIARDAGFELQREITLDIYQERKRLLEKVDVICERHSVENYKNDSEYIEISHLFSIRDGLAHLKPTEQESDGVPERELCRAALNYLFKCKKLIDDPYGSGIYWTDVIMKREVAEWAVSSAVNAIDWLHAITKADAGPFGNSTLETHSRQTKIDWKNHH